MKLLRVILFSTFLSFTAYAEDYPSLQEAEQVFWCPLKPKDLGMSQIILDEPDLKAVITYMNTGDINAYLMYLLMSDDKYATYFASQGVPHFRMLFDSIREFHAQCFQSI